MKIDGLNFVDHDPERDGPDSKLGNYYISVIDGPRYDFLLGPFRDNHAAALALVDIVKEYVIENYRTQGAFWWGYGTCRVDPEVYDKPGKLNDLIPNWENGG